MKITEIMDTIDHLAYYGEDKKAEVVKELLVEVHALKLEYASTIMAYEAQLVKLGVTSISELSKTAIDRYHSLMKDLKGEELEE